MEWRPCEEDSRQRGSMSKDLGIKIAFVLKELEDFCYAGE